MGKALLSRSAKNLPWRQNLVENTQFANNLAQKSQKRILKQLTFLRKI
jgi:hypothetical protein